MMQSGIASLAKFDSAGKLMHVEAGNYLLNYEEFCVRRGFYDAFFYFHKFWIYANSKSIYADQSFEAVRSADIYVHTLEHQTEPKLNASNQVALAMKAVADYFDYLQQEKVHVAVVVLPHPGQISGALNRVFEAKIADLCIPKEIPYLSLFDAIEHEVQQGEVFFSKNPIHLNRHGIHRVSQIVVAWILADPETVIGY